MVEAIRHSVSMRSAARQFGVSLPTVQRWVRRAEGFNLDEVDWSDRPCIPHHTRRTDSVREDLVLSLRNQLRTQSDLNKNGSGPDIKVLTLTLNRLELTSRY
jgi:transposase-like protein